jgi:hypothetical protein
MSIILTEKQTEELLEHIKSLNKVKAILFIRQITGFGLREAFDYLKEFERNLNPETLYGGNHMGMSAKIMAIGPFSKELMEHLEYPPKFYSDTNDGAPIIRFLFEVYEGSSRSQELAGCFGIEAWNFNQHHLDPYQADIDKLRSMFDEDEVEDFLAFRTANFDFLPNG